MPLPALFARRFSKLIIGLFLCGFGISLILRSQLGLAPWDVLTHGLTLSTGWSFGLLTNLIGACVLLLWWPLRQKPGLGTVLNVLLIGPSAQFGLWLLTDIAQPVLQWLAYASGLASFALGSGLYIGARFGPGPRDGLMTGLHARFGWPIWVARTGIESLALLGGWLLGGAVGLGTVGFALLIGPMVQRTLRWCDTRLPAPDVDHRRGG